MTTLARTLIVLQTAGLCYGMPISATEIYMPLDASLEVSKDQEELDSSSLSDPYDESGRLMLIEV